MENTIRLILDCLVAFSNFAMFLTTIITDIKREQREAELARRWKDREEEHE